MEYLVALVEGIYLFVTGIWPLLNMQTFLMVTGPKTDLWLVKTVGMILAVIGAVLVLGRSMPRSIPQLLSSRSEAPSALQLSSLSMLQSGSSLPYIRAMPSSN